MLNTTGIRWDFFCMNNIRQVIRIFVFYKPEIKKQRRQRLILRRGAYLVFHCKFRQVLSISKNWLFAIFSRLRRVVTRWIIASYNIEFLKLPLKTEVFRGSLIDIRAWASADALRFLIEGHPPMPNHIKENYRSSFLLFRFRRR